MNNTLLQNMGFKTGLFLALLLGITYGCGGGGEALSDGDDNSYNAGAMAMLKDGQIPVSDFFKTPEKSGFRISKGGTYFSYLAPHEGKLNIFVQKIGDKKPAPITKETQKDLGGYTWINDEQLIFVRATDDKGTFQLVQVDKDGKNEKDLTPFEGVGIQMIDELPEIPDELILGINQRNRHLFDAYRFNIKTGDTKMVAENPGDINSWLTDHKGHVRIAMSTDGVENTLLYRPTEQDPFKKMLTTDFKATITPLFFDFDNKNVYAVSNLDTDKTAIVLCDLSNGQIVKTIYKNPKVDVSSMAYSRQRKVLTTVLFTDAKQERHFLDKEAESLYADLEAKLPNYDLVITGASQKEDKFLVRAQSDRSMGIYYFYDKNKKELTELANISPWMNTDNLCEMKPISYKSRDGYTINGYLTLPKGSSGKNLPVIVNPHGGPWTRDAWNYRSHVQFFANRGYAVLQMNYRGSIGYGRQFWKASFGEWGGTMQDDITDGAKWLISEGIADPKRIGIYGASYGGYASLMGLVKEPDLFACGVDYVGINNVFAFMNAIPKQMEAMNDMFSEMVGSTEKDSLKLVAVSPIYQAKKITKPLLIAQGGKDRRVVQTETDELVKALKKQGVEIEYFLKADEGHGFRNPKNRDEFFNVMEAFFAKHLK